jgi:PAS domain S-box-containing protein
LHILIVEDQRFDAALLKRLLDSPEVGATRLDHAQSLAEALRYLDKHFYDAALVDLNLPDAHGSDVVRALSERAPYMALVVLTGEDGDEVGRAAMAAGAQDKLSKRHLNAATLAHALHYAVERQRLDAEQQRAFDDYRILFHNSPYPWLVCDRHTLRITTVNGAAEKRYGFSQEAFAAKRLADLFAAEEVELLLELLRTEDLSDGVVRVFSQVAADGRRFRAALTLQSTEHGRRPALGILVRDVTAEERAIRGLERSERRFRKLFQYSPGLICTHDMRGVVLSVNPAAASALGYAASELLGHRFQEFMPERHHAAFAEYLERITRLREDTGTFRLRRADGRWVLWEYHNVLDEDDDGEPYVLGHAQDVSERVLRERRLQDANMRDPLTGCFNRRALEDIEDKLEAEPWAVAVIDLDGFKRINDTQGHAAGDAVLVQMARFLEETAGNRGIVVRTGGDEFVVVGMAGIPPGLVERLDGQRPRSPAAFTVGHAERHGQERLADTIRRADELLYAQRKRQRGPATDE